MTHIINYVLRILYVAIFGYILVFQADQIVNMLPKLLGGMLLLETLAQLVEILLIKKRAKIRNAFFYLPLVVLAWSIILMSIGDLSMDTEKSINENFQEQSLWMGFQIYLSGFFFIALIVSELIISAKYFKPLHRPEQWKEEQAKREAEKKDEFEEEDEPAQLNEGK